jgi:hypothetical protein
VGEEVKRTAYGHAHRQEYRRKVQLCLPVKVSVNVIVARPASSRGSKPALVTRPSAQRDVVAEAGRAAGPRRARQGHRSRICLGPTTSRLAWHALTLPAQRAILAAVVDVTVMPGRRGPQFDAASIVLDFKA